jgi:glycosyltransferase involved in cell wall biosynthesis
MDITNLRINSGRFIEGLRRRGKPLAIQIIHEILQLDRDAFIWEAYKQILLREPDEQGFHSNIMRLYAGVSRVRLIDGMLQSVEAQHLYKQPSIPPGFYNEASLASVMHHLYQANGYSFIHALYREFLCRIPDHEGLQNHLRLMDTAVETQTGIISGFLLSSECQKVLSNLNTLGNILMPSPKPLMHIGMFLGYHHPVNLDGEGIGNFILRLVEGWLMNNEDAMVHVATTEQNFKEVEHLFTKHHSLFQTRLFVNSFSSIDWLNKNVPVDVWCVPYVGLKWALELQKPFILCVHDLVYLHFKDMYYNKQPEFFQNLEPIVYNLANQASKVVFNSDYIRDNEGLTFLGLPLDKTQVIRLAAPSEEYRSYGIREEAAFRETYHLHVPYLVFPSVIRLHKNHYRLIEAFLNFKQTPEGRASNLQMVFTDHYVNRPFEQEILELFNHYKDQSVLNSIVFLGRVSSGDIPSLYKYALGTIVPTLFEGSCPFPILESLSMDTPVAISRIQVSAEVINDMSAFITFDPYSVREIETAIHELWKHSNTRLIAIQKAAMSGALDRTWIDVAQEYYNLFHSIISAK